MPLSSQVSFWKERASDTLSSWRELASPKNLGYDFSAAVTVACVALPLNLALAVASGAPAGAGLVTGIVASALAATLGSARLQISGPEAALVPVSADIVARFGLRGLAVAVLLAGLVQVLLGVLRLGRLARAMPRGVIVGFAAGIGLVLLDRQLPRLLGAPEELSTLGHLLGHRDPWDHVDGSSLLIGGLAIAVILLLPRLVAAIPAMLAALVVSTGVSAVLSLDLGRVGALPAGLPVPSLPSVEGIDLTALAPSVLSLVVLASLGSLLSSKTIDSLRPHAKESDPDQELVAQGLANVTSSLFGGLPVMGAVIRSTTAIHAGARTRATGIGHALLLFAAMTLAATVVAAIPFAALAGLLLVVGVRLVNPRGIVTMWKESRSVAIVAVSTAIAICATNFIAGIVIGLTMAFLLERATRVRLKLESHAVALAGPEQGGDAGEVRLVTVRGPLTFLSQGDFREVLAGPPWPRYLVLDIRHVPLVDAGGLNELVYVSEFLAIRGVKVALAGANPRVRRTIERVDVAKHFDGSRVYASVEQALEGLRRHEVWPMPQRTLPQPVLTPHAAPHPVVPESRERASWSVPESTQTH